MAYGLKIINQNGFVQIDQNYRNQRLVQKEHLTTADVNAGSTVQLFGPNLYYIIRTVPGDFPVIALCPDDSGICLAGVERVTQVSGGWQVMFVMLRAIVDGTDRGLPSNAGFTYYAFNSSSISNDDFGLRVFDSQGNVSFDSGFKYLRVLSSVSYTGRSTDIYLPTTPNICHSRSPGYGAYITVPSGKKYAIVQSNVCADWLWDDDDFSEQFFVYWFRSFVGAYAANIGVHPQWNGELGPFSGISGTSGLLRSGVFLLVDVTNY